METLISHTSALDFWRSGNHARAGQLLRTRRKQAPVGYRKATELRDKGSWKLPLPLHVMVKAAAARRPSQAVRPHLYTSLVPEGSILAAGNGLLVSSPEFVFAQMASELPLAKLIELGFELCGSYSLPSNCATGPAEGIHQKGFYNRSLLTDTKRLSQFLARVGGGLGHERALRAMRYIADSSASPMETILVMLLTLPKLLGGYGMPMPELNSRIIPAKAARDSSGKAFYACDLFWPSASLVVEYDSNMFHTGAERIASDSRRRNTLTSTGLTMITVTNQQIRNAVEFDRIAKQIAAIIGRRTQARSTSSNIAQRELRKLLLGLHS